MADDRSKQSSSTDDGHEPASSAEHAEDRAPAGAAPSEEPGATPPAAGEETQRAARRQWLDSLISRLDEEHETDETDETDETEVAGPATAVRGTAATDLDATTPRDPTQPPSIELEVLDEDDVSPAADGGSGTTSSPGLQSLGHLELDEPGAGSDEPTRPGLSIESYLHPSAASDNLLELETPEVEDSQAERDGPKTGIYPRLSNEDDAPVQLDAGELDASEVVVPPDWAHDSPTTLRRSTDDEEPATTLRRSTDDEEPATTLRHSSDDEEPATTLRHSAKPDEGTEPPLEWAHSEDAGGEGAPAEAGPGSALGAEESAAKAAFSVDEEPTKERERREVLALLDAEDEAKIELAAREAKAERATEDIAPEPPQPPEEDIALEPPRPPEDDIAPEPPRPPEEDIALEPPRPSEEDIALEPPQPPEEDITIEPAEAPGEGRAAEPPEPPEGDLALEPPELPDEGGVEEELTIEPADEVLAIEAEGSGRRAGARPPPPPADVTGPFRTEDGQVAAAISGPAASLAAADEASAAEASTGATVVAGGEESGPVASASGEPGEGAAAPEQTPPPAEGSPVEAPPSGAAEAPSVAASTQEPAASVGAIADEREGPVEPTPDVIDQACALAREQSPRELDAALSRELDAEADPHRQAVLQYELGHLLQSHQDEARAVKAYAQALNADPLLRPNVWAIRRIFVARQLWPNLLKLQDAEVRFEEEPARKAELLLEKGWIQQDQLKDAAGAAESFLAAHEVNPRWLAPLLGLEKLALLAGDLTLLCDVYRKMVSATEDGARRAALLQELARLEEQRAGGTPQQALQLLEEAYALGQDRSGILELMEQVALHAGLHLEVTSVLRRQADELLRRADPDRPLAAAKLRLAAQIARSRLDDPALAQNLFAAALEALPDEEQLQVELLELCEDRKEWGVAASLLERLLERQVGALPRANLFHRLGLARAAAGDARAAEAFTRAREELPGFLPALVADERRLLGASDLDALARLWVAEADAVEASAPGVLPIAEGSGPEWAAAALWRAAVIVQQLNRADQAIALCRRALRVSPGFEPARDELGTLLRRSADHRALAALIEERLVGAPARTTELLLEELLALYAGPINDPAKLLAVLRRLREARGGDRRLLRREVEVLERLGSFAELEETLRTLEDGESDEVALCGWKLSRARLLEGPLARADEAIPLYQQILDRQPDHPFAFAGLEALLRRLGRHQDVSALLRAAADQSPETEEGRPRRLRLLGRLGILEERQLGRPREAMAVYAELAAQQPGDRAALRDLARAAAAAGDTARQVEALEGLVALASSPVERVGLQLRLAEILEDKLADPLRAEELLRSAAEAADPALCPDVFDALARRQIVRGDYAEAARGLEALQTAVPVDAASALLEERAWLSAGPADEPGRGDELWSRVLEQQPQNRRALLARQRLAARQRRPMAVAEVAAQLGTLSQDPATSLALRLRAGTLGEAAGEPLAGAEAYAALLRDTPSALEAICGLLARADLAVDERADLVGRLAEVAPERVREDMRLHRAEICERAGRLREAASELGPLLEKDPDHLPALFLAQRLAEASGNREQEARCWARIGQLLSAEGAKADALSKAADLLLQLGRKDEVVALLRRVLILRPQDRAAQDRLRRLYEERADHRGIDELLGHRIQHAEDLGSRVALHLERANLRLQSLSDRGGGARELLAVLRLEPKHLEALRQLSRLYDEDGNSRRALELYGRYLELVESLPVKRPALLRVADLLLKLGRASEAVDLCRRFLEQAPEDEEVLGRLAELYVEVKDFPHAVSTLEKLGGLKPDRTWRAQHLRRMGSLYWDQLKDLPEARTTLLRARDLDPTNLEVVGSLRRLCREMEQPAELKRVLERAKDDLREALAAQPHSVDLYRKLMQVSEWDEDEYSLLSAMGGLCALGAADREDRELYQRRVAKVSFEPKRQMTSKIWRDALTDPGAKGAHADVWALLAEALPKLFEGRAPGDASQLGGRSRKVDRKAGGPVWDPLDRMAAAFGILHYDIFLTDRDAEFIGGVASDPPAVVVGHSVVTSMTPARRFRLGRLFSLLRDRAVTLEAFSKNELELLFDAAVALVRPDATYALPRSQVEPEARRLGKALPKRTRKALQLPIERLLHDGGELDTWVQGVLTTANRAGLLVCGDVLVALDEMVPELREARSVQQLERVAKLLDERPQAAQVLAFSASREYLNLRRELQV